MKKRNGNMQNYKKGGKNKDCRMIFYFMKQPMFPLKKYFPVIIIIYLFMNINLEVTKFAGKI